MVLLQHFGRLNALILFNNCMDIFFSFFFVRFCSVVENYKGWNDPDDKGEDEDEDLLHV